MYILSNESNILFLQSSFPPDAAAPAEKVSIFSMKKSRRTVVKYAANCYNNSVPAGLWMSEVLTQHLLNGIPAPFMAGKPRKASGHRK